MTEKLELSPKAEALLMTAKPETVGVLPHKVWMINRTLGFQTWQTQGVKGKRADVAELYRLGLVKEWANPWCPPLFLTREGIAQFELRAKHD